MSTDLLILAGLIPFAVLCVWTDARSAARAAVARERRGTEQQQRLKSALTFCPLPISHPARAPIRSVAILADEYENTISTRRY